MTSGLATLVAGIWTEAGYETTISHRDGETYVLAEHGSGGTYDLLWVLDPGADLTAEDVERYRSRIATLDVNDAYAVTGTAIDAESQRAAKRHGIHAVGVATLRSLADDSGVGQDAVDAALATTVSPDADDGPPDGANATGGDQPGDGTAEAADHVDLTDPDQQATIRQRMAVMIGEADPDETPEEAPSEAAAQTGADATGTDHDDASAGDSDPASSVSGDEAAADPDSTEDGETGESDTGGGDPLEPVEGLDGADGSDPFGDQELPDDPARDDDGGGGGGPLRSRRGLITGGVAAVLSAGVLDFAVFNVVVGGGGGGMPAYNETRVKTEAARYTPRAIMADPDGFASQEVAVVFEDAVVTDVGSSGGLTQVTVDASGTVVGRWDGEDPTIGSRYTLWGVVTGTTTVADEDVPTVDIVDLASGDGGTTTAGTTAGTATGTPGTTAGTTSGTTDSTTTGGG